MRLSVTGASGFLGRHICQCLLERDIKFQPLHFKNPLSIEGLKTQSRHLDIHTLPENLFEHLGKPDVLIHLSWAGLPNYNDKIHHEKELQAQQRFLEKAINQGLKSVFVTGTCFEYGMQNGALSEANELQSDLPYGQAKIALLRYLQQLQNQHSFNLTWGRLFYMYGAGQSKSSLWSQFQAAVKNGHDNFDMSAGQQVRDFLPVETIAKIIVDLALKQENLGALNICSGDPITVEALVLKWVKEAGWQGKLNLGVYPYPSYEPMQFWGDKSKLDSIFIQ